MPTLINYWGYHVEEHWVTTEDGYILGLHRIPHGHHHHFPPIIMSHASSSTPLYVQCTGRGETASPRPVVYLQHCLTCSSAIWVFGISPSSWWLLSSPPASHEITIHAIYMQCHNFRPDFNGNQAPLKSPWPSFWRTLAMMFGWATAGETLIQGGLHHHSHHCHAHHDDHHNLKEPHDIRGLLI